MLTHVERGKLGSKNFWAKYKTDKNFRRKILEKWREIRIKNYQNSIQLPKISKNKEKILKSRLCGMLAADGSVFIRKEPKTGRVHYELRFYPDHYSLVELFIKTFKDLYGKEPHVKKYENYFALSISNKVAVLDLLSISKFKSRNWTLPKILKSKETKIEWLRSYFDCDGYVNKNYIQVQSVNKEGLNQIQKLLKEFKISSKIYSYKRKKKSWNINYLLNIPRNMCKNFLEIIGFNHELKKEKAQNLFVAEVA